MRIERLHPIPETRDGFKKNELPICQQDIRALAQVYGEEVAEAARFTAQVIRLQGGVNPLTIDYVFPNGREGKLDEQELMKVIANVATWQSIE